MEVARLVLDFVRVLVSWPVITLILGIYFLHNFKESVNDFFRRFVEGEAYGVKVKAATPSDQRKEVKDAQQFTNLNDVERHIVENPKAVIVEYQKLLNGFRWERAFNLIYGTQLKLLEYLEQKGSAGDKYVNLLPFYNEFVRRSKLSATQYADYLGFLRDSQFIELSGPDNDLVVKITPYGVDFFSYLKGQYPFYGNKVF